jgi:4-hydroxy-tetrahydrodipicolinate synthase
VSHEVPRDPSSLRGSIAPVVTPFTADGELDTEGLRRLIGWQLDSGSHGISLGGSTGEPSAQTPGERIAAMTEAARLIADRVPFLPGTGSPDWTRRSSSPRPRPHSARTPRS